MPGRTPRLLGPLLVLALAFPALAQGLGRPAAGLPTAPEPSTPPAKDPGEGGAMGADEAKPDEPGFLGDTKRFSRLGGWGSIGGAMGQFGLARSALIMMSPVQEELELTPEQKEDLREWLVHMRERGEQFAQTMREEARDGGDFARQGDVPIAARLLQFTNMMNRVGVLLKENEAGVARILTAPQRKRLNEISLQMEGVSALSRPEVARSLNLSPGQVELIGRTLNGSRTLQMTTWIQQAVTMSGRRGNRPAQVARTGEPPAGSDPGKPRQDRTEAEAREQDKPQPAEAETKAEPGRAEENEEEARRESERDERRKQARKEFEAMRDRTDAIQDRATREVLKILTRRQRERFDKMLGEPFDPSKLDGLGRDDRNRESGETQRPAAATTEPD